MFIIVFNLPRFEGRVSGRRGGLRTIARGIGGAAPSQDLMPSLEQIASTRVPPNLLACEAVCAVPIRLRATRESRQPRLLDGLADAYCMEQLLFANDGEGCVVCMQRFPGWHEIGLTPQLHATFGGAS